MSPAGFDSVTGTADAPAPAVPAIPVVAEDVATCGVACWVALVDEDGKTLRVKVNDGEIVFPKTAVGKMAIAEGEFKKIERTRDQAIAQAKHEAEESGRKFDPARIKSGTTSYQINGVGAVILE